MHAKAGAEGIWREREREIARTAKGYLLDWDGCCAVENKLLPGAAAFLSRHAKQCVIVSNNSTNTEGDFARIIARCGIQFPASRIVLAGVEAIRRASELGAERVLLLADTRMRRLARQMNLTLKEQDPDLVVLLRDTSLTYDRLVVAAHALAAGARLIVSNPDLTHPGARGRPIPETGAILAALGACVDLRTIDMEMIGKPSPQLFRRASQILQLPYEQLAMLGDNPKTDVAGAEALGMDHLLVRGSPSEFFDQLNSAVRTA